MRVLMLAQFYRPIIGRSNAQRFCDANRGIGKVARFFSQQLRKAGGIA